MLRTIIALVLIAHGIGHVMGFLEAWTGIPVGFSRSPWLFSDGVLMDSTVGRAFGVLALIAMIGWVGAGLGLLGDQAWWRPLALMSAVVSLVFILPWWNTLSDGFRIGGGAFDLAAMVVLATGWPAPLDRALL